MFQKIRRVLQRQGSLHERLNRIQEALGRIEMRQVRDAASPGEAEFRVFSQWGEDGILQYLLRRIPVARRVFVEFGVENYVESNTRFLLTNDQWSGLVMDGSQENIEYIRRDPIYWAANLKAVHAFITRENINELLSANGIAGEIGLLSIDIDGNDYWVWEAIEGVSPALVAIEYASQFGPEARVSTPYDPAFVRDSAHYSKVYYGASLAALEQLGRRKGYTLVATNRAGNNAFFVREDLRGGLPALTAREAYRRAQFREFHGPDGALTFDDFETRLRKLGDLPLHDFDSGQVRRIADLPAVWQAG